MTYVLVTCVSKNNDRERCENLERAFDMNDVDITTRRRGVVSGEVVDHENYEVTDRNKCNDGSILQAVEPAQK